MPISPVSNNTWEWALDGTFANVLHIPTPNAEPAGVPLRR